MPKFHPRIAIIGAGPSGLALALLLRQNPLSNITIYELRLKPSSAELSKPSGMLDLHVESGQKVMRECGLWESFQNALGDCSESCRVMNPQGEILHTDEGEFSSRPEIARNSLTKILLEQIPEGMIRWNSKITAVKKEKNEQTGEAEILVDIEGEKGSESYDFVIGADGAWSRVRSLLSDVQPFYSGCQFVCATIRNVSSRYPHLVDLCGTGTLSALGGGNGIMTHRGPQDSIRVYAAISTPEENWAEELGLNDKNAAEVKAFLLGEDGVFGKWADRLKELVATACDEETIDNPRENADIKPLYMLPVGYRWEHQGGATLVGDAAHLMTPWAGEGVNLALWDSLDLAHVLTSVPEVEDAVSWQLAIEPGMRKFEEGMLEKAQEKAEETVRNRDMLLSENGGQAMADFFKMMQDMAVAGGLPTQE